LDGGGLLRGFEVNALGGNIHPGSDNARGRRKPRIGKRKKVERVKELSWKNCKRGLNFSTTYFTSESLTKLTS